MSLEGLDRGLAWFSWLVAGVLVLMLLVGPKVVAEDKGKVPATGGGSPYAAPAQSPTAADGKALFASNCGSCHTLSAAGTNGALGPKLDGLKLAAPQVQSFMKAGPGAMPSFASLPAPQRDAIAKFVAASSR